MRFPSSLALLASLALGLVLWLVGFAAAWMLLPEWRWQGPGDRSMLEQAHRSIALELGLEPGEEPPRLALTTLSQQDAERARRVLAEDTRGWVTEHGVTALVTVTGSARWAERPGRLTVDLGAGGEPWAITWVPLSLREFLGLGGPIEGALESICGPLRRSGEVLGEPLAHPSAGQGFSLLFPLEGGTSRVPHHLMQVDLPGATVLCQRRPGEVAAGVMEAEAELEGIPGELLKWLGIGLGLALVAALFVWLAVRQRLDLVHGGVLAIAFTATALAASTVTGPQAIFLALVVVGKGVWIFLLWSVAESTARSAIPAFSTSLDSLRRGRLGRRAGRSLILGVALGAGLAGAMLGLAALAEALPGIHPLGLTVAAPLFGKGANPIGEGAVWCGLALLVYALASHLLPPRRALLVAALATGMVASPVALRPWPAQALVAALLTALLLAAFRRFGLTTALVGTLVAFALPSGLWALLTPAWAAGTWAGGLALVWVPLVAGFIGVVRGGDDSTREAAPGFVRRLERERRLAYEMDLLARMQTGLLPRSLPRVPGYELTARSLLASEAGGDLYDFLRDDRGRLWIACGDVAGHGYSCAIAQATVKAALVSLVDGERTPAQILGRVDKVLRATLSEQQFVTLSLLRLTPDTGELLVANAAHPFPLLWRGGAVTELDLPGLPLGQGPPREYRDLHLELALGEVLVVYSDGLAEALSPEGNEYGFDRPREALASAAHWNAAEVLERLLWDWRRHLDGRAHMDDTTLVVLKRGAAAGGRRLHPQPSP